MELREAVNFLLGYEREYTGHLALPTEQRQSADSRDDMALLFSIGKAALKYLNATPERKQGE